MVTKGRSVVSWSQEWATRVEAAGKEHRGRELLLELFQQGLVTEMFFILAVAVVARVCMYLSKLIKLYI